MVSLCCVFRIIFSINSKKENSTGTLIQLLSDCPILYEIKNPCRLQRTKRKNINIEKKA